MYIFRLLAVCGILVGLGLASVGGVAAQERTPFKTLDVRIGPYEMTVSYYSQAEGGRQLVFSIAPRAPLAGEMHYEVTAVPGTLVNAVPVKATLSPDPDHAGGVRGTVNLPVSGQWLLNVRIDGPLGSGSEDVPVLAAAPPALPRWLGWAIGLLPVWAIVGFVLWRARRKFESSVVGAGVGAGLAPASTTTDN